MCPLIRGRGRRTKFRLTLLGGVTPLENNNKVEKSSFIRSIPYKSNSSSALVTNQLKVVTLSLEPMSSKNFRRDKETRSLSILIPNQPSRLISASTPQRVQEAK